MANDKTHVAPSALLGELRRCGLRRRGHIKRQGSFEIHKIDLVPLKIRAGHFVPFVIPVDLAAPGYVGPDQTSELLTRAKKIAESEADDFAVLLLGRSLKKITPSLYNLYKESFVVLIAQEDMKEIVRAKTVELKLDALSLKLTKTIGIRTLSPYVPGRPAYGGCFFGRSDKIKKVLAAKTGDNFTIIGNRRIGKTSFLKEIKGRLRDRNPRLRVAELYGSTWDSPLDAAQYLLTQLDPRAAAQAEKARNYPQNMPTTVQSIIRSNKVEVALFVDEFDRLLELDELDDFKVLHIFREMCEKTDSCRIFFAGFRRVMDASTKVDHPLFNFTQTIILDRLSRQESLEMVTVPLRRLGVSAPSADLVSTIYKETAGHPELIQMFCATIVDLAADGDQISHPADLLDVIFTDPTFESKVLGAFLANSHPLEEITSYLLLDKAEKDATPIRDFEFSPADLGAVLSDFGLHLDTIEIYTLAKNMAVAGTISRVHGTRRFRFSVPQLARYCSGLNLQTALEDASRRLSDKTRPMPPVWSEPFEEGDNLREEPSSE